MHDNSNSGVIQVMYILEFPVLTATIDTEQSKDVVPLACRHVPYH